MPLRRPHARALAFTLIELMIVLAVIALLAVAAGPALGGLTGADARRAAAELSGSMRWLFDSASVRHATCRLVLSPGDRTFRAECAPGRTTIDRDPEKAAEREEEEARRAEEASAEGAGADAAAGGGANGFKAFSDAVVTTRELPGATEFTAIRVDGRDVLSKERPAYVHFFPGGRAQAARVTIGDGGHVFTVRLEPFTGRARVFAGEPPPEDE
jgi:general secretion pathway protein H